LTLAHLLPHNNGSVYHSVVGTVNHSSVELSGCSLLNASQAELMIGSLVGHSTTQRGETLRHPQMANRGIILFSSSLFQPDSEKVTSSPSP
jgi:hypothetical protein